MMREDVLQALRATSFYHCVLLIHPEVARLRQAAAGLAKSEGWPELNVGQAVAADILAIPFSQRTLAAQRTFAAAAAAHAPGPLLCVEIDLLFDPALSLDPLALLREASRQTALIVAWPGVWQGDVLSYAAPEHAHYRTWRSPEVQICPLA